jgi:hypothetical protein
MGGKKVHKTSERDLVNLVAICQECGPVRLVSRGEKNGFVCENGRKANRKKQSAEGIRKRRERLAAILPRPISPEEAAIRAVIASGGPCEICGLRSEVADHCHKTGRWRGPLCNLCNRGIGLFRDDPEVMRQAIVFLVKHADA